MIKPLSIVLLVAMHLRQSNAKISADIFTKNLKICNEEGGGDKKINYLNFLNGQLPETSDEKCFLACMGEKFDFVSYNLNFYNSIQRFMTSYLNHLAERGSRIKHSIVFRNWQINVSRSKRSRSNE